VETKGVGVEILVTMEGK